MLDLAKELQSIAAARGWSEATLLDVVCGALDARGEEAVRLHVQELIDAEDAEDDT